MKAAVVYAPRDIRVEEVPDREPGPGEVLCRVRSAGICGSDLHGYRSGGHHQPTSGPVPYPRVAPGHEIAGVVAAVGAGETGLAIGDRVGIEPLVGCGTCRACRMGSYHYCPHLEHIGGKRPGGFAEFTIAPAEKCYRLPDNVSDDEAATLDCAAVAVHALHRVPIRPHDTVVVIGTGAIGLYTAAVARAAGAQRVVVVGGHRDGPLDVARELGAHHTVNAEREDPVAVVRDLTDGRGADVVFETVGGAASTFGMAIDLAGFGGTVGILGVFPQPQTIDTRPAMRRELSVLWSWSYATWNGVPEYQIALDMLADGRVRASAMITHRFPLDQIAEAYACAGDKSSSDAIKVCVHP